MKAQESLPIEDGESSDSDYKDDDPVAAPTPILAKDKVQVAFDEILLKARSSKLNLGKKENRKEFMEYYGDLLAMKTQAYDQTLLHMIANTLGHRSLTRCVVKNDKKLLEHKDESGRTPLHIAIAKKNFDFLSVVLGEIDDLDMLLRITCEHSRNCIHMAVYHGLGQEYTVELIKRASEATLCATDQDGLTPLHLAVEYERSSELHLRIVQTLITYGDSALDKFTTNPKDLSAYEYHQHTRSRAAKKSADSVAPRGPERSREESPARNQGYKNNPAKGRAVTEGPLEHSNDKGTAVPQEPSRAERGQAKALEGLSLSSGRRGSAFTSPTAITMGNHLAYALHLPTTEERKPPIKGPQPTPDSTEPEYLRLDRRTTGAFPRGSRKDDDSARRVQEDEKQRAKYADKIRQEVKLYYLRTTFRTGPKLSRRDQHKASRFLYGANVENIDLCFDYFQAPMTILKESFKESYDHMSFDEVLRYVAFRRIELQQPPVPARESKLAKKPLLKQKPGRGRSDLTFFFDWLYRKNVRHILKVIVDDLKDPPHSDMAIEDSLRRFEIETLDWRRIDLCPETLFNACQNVREVFLRWSGNRAILRAWSEPEGLPRLEKLEQVHLVWNSEQILESADRIESYMKDFQERLDQTLEDIDTIRRNQEAQENGITPNVDDTIAKRKILVYRSEENVPNTEQLVQSSGPTKTLSNASERNLQSNRWLECMDKFADEIQNVKVPTTDNVILKSDIKVALIDDGADPYVESLRGKIRGGESFDRGYPNENGPSPYYTSSKGHGTVMADMICRVCPMAKLYVYKLETHSSINPTTQAQSRNQISTESAALAITAAVNQNVDVISMSWTVRETEDNHKSISELREAIKAALDARILLFCTAADTGAVNDVEYPWAFDQRRIFRIGAATADGRVWGPTGSPQNLSFIVPGHKVVSRNPHREGALPDDFEERTGSSIATALAAGLAALILHCVRLGAIQTELETRQGILSSTAVKAAEFERVKDHDSMNGVLKAIGLDEGQQRFIEVWKRFDGPAQNLKSPNADTPSELAVIAKLARDLVSGITSGSS